VAADLLKLEGRGRDAIPSVFLTLMAQEPDTFIAKKFGRPRSMQVQLLARQVTIGSRTLSEFDEYCIKEGINPGSLADILIAGLFVAMSEGWEWDQ
jgi:triphosphoribosyl-dephospho-CoA synthase